MRKPRIRFLNSATRRYAALGAGFGLMFPLVATSLSILVAQLPFSLASAITVQKSQPLLWIIDTAPIFLGLFAALAGRREDALERSNETLRDLSARSKESEIEVTRKLEERSAQLNASADVGRAAVSILNPDQLLAEIVNLITDRFGFYYAAIFTLDRSGNNVVLREATGEAGRILKERGHKLRVGLDSMVGYVVLKREPRVALDVGQDAIRFANPLLPETRSEIALPLVVGDEVLGALDVQSKAAGAFDENSLAVLQGMTDQIAVALLNARSFSDLQTTLAYTMRQNELSRIIFGARTTREAYAALGQVYAIMSDLDRISLWMVTDRNERNEPLEYEAVAEWDVLGGAQLDMGLRYRVTELLLASLAAADEIIVIRDAGDVRLPTTTRERLAHVNAQAAMLVPIIVRGQLDGLIVATAEQPRDFTDSEIRLMQGVAEQLGVVLNNLQLTNEMQATMEREALLNRRLSGEAWSSYLTARPALTIESGNAAAATQSARLDLPIVIRGEAIGNFSLADADPDRQWSDEELVLLNTIAGEAALAIDNARLIEQTQRVAQRERTINEINTRVRQTIDLDEILKTAVSELGQSLKAARVVAQVGPVDNDSKTGKVRGNDHA